MIFSYLGPAHEKYEAIFDMSQASPADCQFGQTSVSVENSIKIYFCSNLFEDFFGSLFGFSFTNQYCLIVILEIVIGIRLRGLPLHLCCPYYEPLFHDKMAACLGLLPNHERITTVVGLLI